MSKGEGKNISDAVVVQAMHEFLATLSPEQRAAFQHMLQAAQVAGVSIAELKAQAQPNKNTPSVENMDEETPLRPRSSSLYSLDSFDGDAQSQVPESLVHEIAAELLFDGNVNNTYEELAQKNRVTSELKLHDTLGEHYEQVKKGFNYIKSVNPNDQDLDSIGDQDIQSMNNIFSSQNVKYDPLTPSAIGAAAAVQQIQQQFMAVHKNAIAVYNQTKDFLGTTDKLTAELYQKQDFGVKTTKEYLQSLGLITSAKEQPRIPQNYKENFGQHVADEIFKNQVLTPLVVSIVDPSKSQDLSKFKVEISKNEISKKENVSLSSSQAPQVTITSTQIQQLRNYVEEEDKKNDRDEQHKVPRLIQGMITDSKITSRKNKQAYFEALSTHVIAKSNIQHKLTALLQREQVNIFGKGDFLAPKDNTIDNKKQVNIFGEGDLSASSDNAATSYLAKLRLLNKASRGIQKMKDKDTWQLLYNVFLKDHDYKDHGYMSVGHDLILNPRKRQEVVANRGSYNSILSQDTVLLEKNLIKNARSLIKTGKMEVPAAAEMSISDQQILFQTIDLLFVVEPMRNPAALIHNAMFFDLVEKKVEGYTLADLPNRLPMAMEGAVDGARSVVSKAYPRGTAYDYAGNGDPNNAIILQARENVLLLDWAQHRASVAIAVKQPQLRDDTKTLLDIISSNNKDVTDLLTSVENLSKILPSTVDSITSNKKGNDQKAPDQEAEARKSQLEKIKKDIAQAKTEANKSKPKKKTGDIEEEGSAAGADRKAPDPEAEARKSKLAKIKKDIEKIAIAQLNVLAPKVHEVAKEQASAIKPLLKTLVDEWYVNENVQQYVVSRIENGLDGANPSGGGDKRGGGGGRDNGNKRQGGDGGVRTEGSDPVANSANNRSGEAMDEELFRNDLNHRTQQILLSDIDNITYGQSVGQNLDELRDKQNAFNQRNNQNYYYQDKDIKTIAPLLFDQKKINIGIYAAIGASGAKIQDIQSNYLTLEKPIVGIYNVGGGHWTAFCIMQDAEGKVSLLYKDSQGSGCPKDIKDAAEAYVVDKQGVMLIENTKQEQGGSREVDVNCGIYAMCNAQMIADNITNTQNREAFINSFATSTEFSKYETVKALRQESFAKLYVQAIYNHHKMDYIERGIKEAIQKYHMTELKELKVQHHAIIEVVDTFDKSKNTENKLYFEIVGVNVDATDDYSYQYQIASVEANKDFAQQTRTLGITDIANPKPENSKYQYTISPDKIRSVQPTAHLDKEAIQKIKKELEEAFPVEFSKELRKQETKKILGYDMELSAPELLDIDNPSDLRTVHDIIKSKIAQPVVVPSELLYQKQRRDQRQHRKGGFYGSLGTRSAWIEEQLQEKLLGKRDPRSLLESLPYSDPSLKGTGEYGEEKPIGYINPFFGKYTLEGLEKILHMRLQQAQVRDVKVILGTFINDNAHQQGNDIAKVIAQVHESKESKVLAPLNLFNKHAVGMIFEKDANNKIKSIKYLDSLNREMPAELKQAINQAIEGSTFGAQGQQASQRADMKQAQVSQVERVLVEQQRYANCGPEVVENLMKSVTGKRIAQEKAIEVHSMLVEQSLLSQGHVQEYAAAAVVEAGDVGHGAAPTRGYHQSSSYKDDKNVAADSIAGSVAAGSGAGVSDNGVNGVKEQTQVSASGVAHSHVSSNISSSNPTMSSKDKEIADKLKSAGILDQVKAMGAMLNKNGVHVVVADQGNGHGGGHNECAMVVKTTGHEHKSGR